MADDSSEKKYEPSGKRLDDLRRKGQVIRSRDLSGGFLIFSSVTMLSAMGSLFFNQFKDNFIQAYRQIGIVLYQADYFPVLIKHILLHNMILLIPLFTVAIISVLLSVILFGGWNFTLFPLVFNLEKMNPSVNLKNICSMRTVIEVFKSLLKLIVVFSIIFYFLSDHFRDLIQLPFFPVKHAIVASYELTFKFAWSLLISLIFIVSADMLHQHTHYMDSNKMSFQDVKDEQKETDGSQESKRRQKSAQMAITRQMLTTVIPKAMVVVTNPSHYAVALSYAEGKDKAPKVVAKGKDWMAQQIRTLAARHGIPIYPAPPLARALFHVGKIGSEVQPDLYMAVAVVLSYVQQLRNYQQGNAAMPRLAADLSIPANLRFEE